MKPAGDRPNAYRGLASLCRTHRASLGVQLSLEPPGARLYAVSSAHAPTFDDTLDPS